MTIYVLDASAGADLLLDTANGRAIEDAGRLSLSTPHRAQLRTMVPAAWALRHNLTPYDAFYVVLAHQPGATLVSTDERLKRAPNLRAAAALVD